MSCVLSTSFDSKLFHFSLLADSLMAMIDAENINFPTAAAAVSNMQLRDLHEHVVVGPMEAGAASILGLPMRE